MGCCFPTEFYVELMRYVGGSSLKQNVVSGRNAFQLFQCSDYCCYSGRVYCNGDLTLPMCLLGLKRMIYPDKLISNLILISHQA